MSYKSMIMLSLLVLGGIMCSSDPLPSPKNSNGLEEQPTISLFVNEFDDLDKNQTDSISLTALEPTKILNINEIGTFHILLNHDVETTNQVQLILNTKEGSQWPVALCYSDICVLHNGEDPIEQTLQVTAGTTANIEIKVFVPKNAQVGDRKTLTIKSVIGGIESTSSSIDLTGYIP